MAAHDDGFYETALIGWRGQFQERSARIDVVIGSGVRGQSYLSWRGDKLYELPVSYWRDVHKWINSPGYKNGTADFSRAVVPRCLECHSAYIAQRSPDPVSNVYERNSLVVGILCETCHGPGKAHIESETKARSGAGEPVCFPYPQSREVLQRPGSGCMRPLSQWHSRGATGSRVLLRARRTIEASTFCPI